MDKRKDRILLGLILLLIGAYSICKAVGITFPVIVGWWWLIIIIIGIYVIFAKKRIFGGVLITAVGLVFFLAERGVISAALPFPIILVIVGILFIFTPKSGGNSQ